MQHLQLKAVSCPCAESEAGLPLLPDASFCSALAAGSLPSPYLEAQFGLAPYPGGELFGTGGSPQSALRDQGPLLCHQR